MLVMGHVCPLSPGHEDSVAQEPVFQCYFNYFKLQNADPSHDINQFISKQEHWKSFSSH